MEMNFIVNVKSFFWDTRFTEVKRCGALMRLPHSEFFQWAKESISDIVERCIRSESHKHKDTIYRD